LRTLSTLTILIGCAPLCVNIAKSTFVNAIIVVRENELFFLNIYEINGVNLDILYNKWHNILTNV
jgi:hypothetical protein